MSSAQPEHVSPWRIRRANDADLDILCYHRCAMFRDMGYEDAATLDPIDTGFCEWVQPRLAQGEYLAWVAEVGDDGDSEIIAGAGLWLMPWPPHLVGPDKPRANIVNVYTEAAYRRRGIARQLVQTLLAWCRQEELTTVILHASEEGRGLYEELGFKTTAEMILDLTDPESSESR